MTPAANPEVGPCASMLDMGEPTASSPAAVPSERARARHQEGRSKPKRVARRPAHAGVNAFRMALVSPLDHVTHRMHARGDRNGPARPTAASRNQSRRLPGPVHTGLSSQVLHASASSIAAPLLARAWRRHRPRSSSVAARQSRDVVSRRAQISRAPRPLPVTDSASTFQAEKQTVVKKSARWAAARRQEGGAIFGAPAPRA
mmetsp:Transcript_106897/g.340480  ORF Transcript_106897/g.340480 Transcript_106897/m.340480 type:complete len:202 (-) Transcript_106897:7-612(-)